jgi:hypothetical protein
VTSEPWIVWLALVWCGLAAIFTILAFYWTREIRFEATAAIVDARKAAGLLDAERRSMQCAKARYDLASGPWPLAQDPEQQGDVAGQCASCGTRAGPRVRMLGGWFCLNFQSCAERKADSELIP